MSLADILDPLQQPLVTVLDTPVGWTEVLGFGSGALCVWLVARQHLANWPIGIANNLLFILLFTQSGLYADAGLQIVFITLAAYGWWTLDPRGWTGLAGPAGAEHRPHRMGPAVRGRGAGDRRSDRSPRPRHRLHRAVLGRPDDRAVLGCDVRAVPKLVESWWLWITADVVYIPLYAYKELYLTSLLYAGFLALCLVGLRNWKRDLPVPQRELAEVAG